MAANIDYSYVMDVNPQEYEDHNKLYKFYEYLREGRLTTTQCKDCHQIAWPPRTICPKCISDKLEWVDVPKKGTIYSYVVQVNGLPPMFKPPLIYALIDFSNGLRLFSAIIETAPELVKKGMEVELVVRDVAPDQEGRSRILPFFKLNATT